MSLETSHTQIFPRLVAAARNCGQLPDPKQDILSAPSAEGSWAGLVASVTDKGTFWVCSPFTKGQLGECLSCSDLYRVKRESLLKSKVEIQRLPSLCIHLKSLSSTKSPRSRLAGWRGWQTEVLEWNARIGACWTSTLPLSCTSTPQLNLAL